jgi:hypothetical protein
MFFFSSLGKLHRHFFQALEISTVHFPKPWKTLSRGRGRAPTKAGLAPFL